MPGRSYLVLFVELSRKDEALAREVTAQLLQRLPAFEGRMMAFAVGVQVKPKDLDSTPALSIYRRQGK